MNLERKHLIILLIFISAFVLVGGVCAQGDGFSLAGIAKKASATKTVTVKVYNFKPGVLWGPKATKFKNGDAIAGYVEYKGNMQFDSQRIKYYLCFISISTVNCI